MSNIIIPIPIIVYDPDLEGNNATKLENAKKKEGQTNTEDTDLCQHCGKKAKCLSLMDCPNLLISL